MTAAMTIRLDGEAPSRAARRAAASGQGGPAGDTSASMVRSLALLTLIPAVLLGINPIAYAAVNGVMLLLGTYVVAVMLIPRRLPALRRADLIVALDILVVTFVVVLSGRVNSPFLYLYYLVILEAAVRLNARQALAAAGAVAGVNVFLWANAGVNEFLDDPLFKLGLFNAGGFSLAMFLGTLFQGHRSASDVGVAYDTTLEGWSRTLELRDKETEGHTRRVTEMAVRLGRAMGMSKNDLLHLRRGALLHDIGKMGIPDSILLKPGPLTDEQWAIMRRHPEVAYELLSPISYLRPALAIPYCHHEQWDGSGYPRGLRGEEIPLAARIFTVIDVWDALRANRPYSPAWSEGRARDYIRAQAGVQFDPRVVDVFLRMLSETNDTPAAAHKDSRGRVTRELKAAVRAQAVPAYADNPDAPQPTPLAPQAPSPIPPVAPRRPLEQEATSGPTFKEPRREVTR